MPLAIAWLPSKLVVSETGARNAAERVGKGFGITAERSEELERRLRARGDEIARRYSDASMDLLAALRRREERSPLYYRVDWHLDPRGIGPSPKRLRR